MAFAVETRIEIGGDRKLFERVSNSLRNTRELFERIGVLGMSSAARRLEQVLSDDPDAVRTGRLAASLRASRQGGSSPDTIFELGAFEVTIGSNVPYAAQVHFGGRIEPTGGRKAIAIPLLAQIKRSGIWPSEADPQRNILTFVPVDGGAKGNVIGLLVDEEGLFGQAGEALYLLARYVDQEPRPFLFWDDDDRRTIENRLIPVWLGLCIGDCRLRIVNWHSAIITRQSLDESWLTMDRWRR